MSKPLPIISVSQKPIDFGENICVGDVGTSATNCRRQLLIGAKAAKTDFICPAESDFLYPPEIFKFMPESKKRAYLFMPIYVFFVQRGKAKVFCPKPRVCEGTMMVGRKYIIEKLETILEGKDEWVSYPENDVNREIPHLLHLCKQTKVFFDTASVTFKTDNNMHRKTPHSINGKTRQLPHWGTSKDLINKYCK